MTAKGHMFLATGITLPIAAAAHIPVTFDFLIGIVIGSWLPDLDEPGSYLGRRLFLISYLLKAIGIQHRTLTHSILFAILVTLPALFIPELKYFFFGLGVGVILHCIGDLLTKSGLQYFFFPIKKQIHLLPKNLRFRTGSNVEYLVIIPFILLTLFSYKYLHISDYSGFKELHIEKKIEKGLEYFVSFVKEHQHDDFIKNIVSKL